MADRTYDDAITLLNTLQTPFAVLKQRRDAGIRIDETSNEEMLKCLELIGYSQSDLTSLNILHIAGTKGKGSTCAYIDSMLTNHHLSTGIPPKVGLFTSPHLIAVRERIRINSAPISAPLFTKYFFEVWDQLENAGSEFNKPVYFRYLTLLSYHVFIQEKVDTAIYETGVGGQYDSTNIVLHPLATGITTLGIDHTFALGNTIDSIAWHKAGIQKPSVPSFTVPQVAEALEVVKSRAEERKVSSFTIVEQDPRLQASSVKIKPDAPFQHLNASLAISITETALKTLDPNFTPSPSTLPQSFIDGLQNVIWRGRFEKIEEGNVTWYLDGAHTTDSIKVATKWFGDEISEQNGEAINVLIFNQQGHREAISLLEDLYNFSPAKFTHVLFCPTVQHVEGVKKTDFVNNAYDNVTISSLALQKQFALKWVELTSRNSNINVLPSISECFEYARGLGKEGKVNVLVTGSVHLVGSSLGLLEGVDAV